MVRRPTLLLALGLIAACGGGGSAADDAGGLDGALFDAASDASDGCAPVAADPDDYLTLADTGLYCDPSVEMLRPGVRPFEPRFPLWADGATKRRWVYLPPGTTIDTGDMGTMDYWQFPVGTKFWKEFSRDGERIETRLMERTGPLDGEWEYLSFLWNADQTAAANTNGQPVENGGDEHETEHDVPDLFACIQCHNRISSKALGFSAIQLDHAPGGDNVTLETLVSEATLSNPPTKASDATEYFPLPGSATAVAASGYLHGNCGGCHFTGSPILVSLVMRHEVAHLATLEDTLVYSTGVGIDIAGDGLGATKRIDPMAPGNSGVLLRMQARPVGQMPPVGSEIPDTLGGIVDVTAWVNELVP